MKTQDSQQMPVPLWAWFILIGISILLTYEQMSRETGAISYWYSTACFYFFLLILTRHSWIIAYLLFPCITGCRLLAQDSYDLFAPLLNCHDLHDFIDTLKIHRHYQMLPGHTGYDICEHLVYYLVVSYLTAYLIRRKLPEIHIKAPAYTWCISGIFVAAYLIWHPIGFIPK